MSDQRIAAMPYNRDLQIIEEPEYRPRVVVKFRDDVTLPYRDGVEDEIKKLNPGRWDELEHTYPGITLQRLFASLPPERILALVSEGREYDKTYQSPNFLTYFAIDCPVEVKPETLATDLARWDIVQEAYVEGVPAPPPLVHLANNPGGANQGYLKAADLGIDVEYAWTLPGGDGTGVQFVDLEQGWMLNHEDLVAGKISLISGVNKSYLGHGTAVLGQIVASDNVLGGVGIAPMAHSRVVSLWQTDTVQNIADAILVANNVLQIGDVLLIEAQVLRLLDLYPCEIETAIFDSIRACTARGVIVVEAAGNGNLVTGRGNSLDTFATLDGKQILNPKSADFKDSVAIMVAAASSTVPHQRMAFSNHGTRIDCYAWGENVTTSGDGWAGSGVADYTNRFMGTSSAAPIIAGAALIVQSVNKARGGHLNAFQMRDLLRDPMRGTAPSPAGDDIGVMPNLRQLI